MNEKNVVENNYIGEQKAIEVMGSIIGASYALRRVSKQTEKKYNIRATRHHIYDDKENCNPVVAVRVQFTIPEEEAAKFLLPF